MFCSHGSNPITGTGGGQVLGSVLRKVGNGGNSLQYPSRMTVENRLIAVTYLASWCNPESFWLVAASLLNRGIDPEEFDAELLSAAQ